MSFRYHIFISLNPVQGGDLAVRTGCFSGWKYILYAREHIRECALKFDIMIGTQLMLRVMGCLSLHLSALMLWHTPATAEERKEDVSGEESAFSPWTDQGSLSDSSMLSTCTITSSG